MAAPRPARRPADVAAVIPTFNHAHYLPETLETVLAQTRPVREIVVVDDGSTDDTEHALQRFTRDGRVRYLRQENAGASVARNRGIQATTARYVAFLDSDDRWLPQKIERQMKLFEGEPELGTVSCAARVMDGDRILSAEFSTRDVFFELLCRGNVLGGSASSAVIRRDCLDTVGGFDARYRVCQDWDLWMRVARRYRVRCIPDALTLYRVVAGSNSMSQRVEIMESNLAELLGELFADPHLPPHVRAARRAVYAHHRVVTAKSYAGQKKYGKALRVLARSMAVSPMRTLHAWRRSADDTRRLDPALARKIPGA